jgi:hypothetical protein
MNLKDLENKTILMFGKPRAFSEGEFNAQLKHHNISTCREFSDEVKVVVDGKMMTPYEQNDSDALYEKYSKEIEFISIDVFEKELAKYVDEDTLLMSLKLSRDEDRLKSFILNSMISDELFFKILKMYSWGEDDFFESDDNRDVSAAFISRFYENIERNHNVQYATTGFVHLIKQSKNSKLLEVILSLKPIKYNPKMKMQIAMSEFSSEPILKALKKDDSYEIKEALSLNKNLNKEIVQEFIKDEKLGSNIAKSINLNDEYFTLLQEYKIALSLNESLTLKMQEELFRCSDDEIDFALSLNDNIDLEILKKLLESDNETVVSALYENKIMPIQMLEEAYKNNRYLEQLAKNENTPIEILYQLQLDSKYERAVKTNAGFGKHIQQENIGWLV